ncbi:unnamed protein product [Ilex paraguariensis]|uniref:Thioredoxin domain-containing protein n=1 Tax=Ilex paraguariensis TaxID=185542 RepID=A0ABC8U9G0_9AQUA
MNSLRLLRKSATPCSKRLTLASISNPSTTPLSPSTPRDASISTKSHYFSTSTTSIRQQSKSLKWVSGNYGVLTRNFRVGGGSLNFRASEVLSQAELAFANFSDEDKSLGASGAGDDGLEISKLGISGEVIQALAKKVLMKQGMPRAENYFQACWDPITLGILLWDIPFVMNARHARRVYVGGLAPSANEQEYGIQGFPTIKVFAPGKPPVDYQGARDVKPIVEYALQQLLLKERLNGKAAERSSEKSEPSASVELNSRNFDECGHCKKLAPEWKKAANKLKGKVKLGHVDCDVEKVVLEYADVESATKARTGLNGRKFGGKPVVAVFYPENEFSEGDYDG